MKILVLEWDISRFSGRMATMVRFADAFKELGHEVHMVSNWAASEIRNKEDLFYYHNTRTLVDADFSWGLQRKYDVFPEEWKRYDFIFAPYVAYGHLSELPEGRPTVCWWISQQNGWSNKTLEFWTNSRTTWDMLKRVCGRDDIHVIVPPYDYSVFRDRIESKDKRSFDIAYLARAHPNKDLETFCRTAKTLDLRAVLAVLCKNAIQKQYALSLVDRYKNNVSLLMNADKATLAEFLGNTKVYFHPSKDESCSIAVYEALNAGCFPICRAAGAVREQLDGIGLIYNKEDDPVPLVKLILEGMDWDVLSIAKRGMTFDKTSVMRELKTRLGEIERCLP